MSISNGTTNNHLMCPHCKAILPSDSMFCSSCGTKLTDDTVQEQTLAEQQRQEEIEQLEIEKKLAVLERFAAVEAANKRKKKIKTFVILIAVVLIAILLLKEMRDNAYQGELRNFATDVMDDSFTNVYADVVSMQPRYFVYTYEETSYGTRKGDETLWEVVCKCKTIEGKTIWATFFYQYYPEGDYSQNEDDYKSFTYTPNNPLRIFGSVDTAHQVHDELEDAIGDVFVLDVQERPRLNED